MYYRNTRYLIAEHSPVYFHEHVTTSLDIHRCYIIGNPLQIWDFWQLANKLNFLVFRKQCMYYSNWTLHTFVKKIPAIAFILIIAFMLLKLSLFWYLQKLKKFAFLLVNSEWWIFMKTRKVKIKKADRTINNR